MILEPLKLKGAFLIKPERKVDERGFFARTFCAEEFAHHGLISQFIQMSTSFNTKEGQIRGMHFQEDPYAETKVIRCTKGTIYDVIVDIRPESPTYNQWHGQVLSAENGYSYYAPKGFAHGYKTLEENTEIFYMMDQIYVKDAAREINHLDPKLNINWE